MPRQSNHDEFANMSEIIPIVRDGDYDRFLAIQLAPKAKRAALYALTAVHVEITRIADIVSEPMLGHIRLAWWREAVEELMAGKAPRHHPATLALAPWITQQPLLADCLFAMLDARAVDFDDALVADEAAWLAYCDGTVGALHRAWALVLDAKAAVEYEVVIAAQARACAMVGLVRAIPLMAARGHMCFPQARIDPHGVESLAPSPALNAMVASIIAQCASMAMDVRLKNNLLPLIGLTLLNKKYTQVLQRNGCNPYGLMMEKLGKVWVILKLNYL